ncbi:MAG: hypothetical protein H0X13_19920 [Ramlibacter sp.]|nr:hypothetical protein [Ramlibacter sp.]
MFFSSLMWVVTAMEQARLEEEEFQQRLMAAPESERVWMLVQRRKAQVVAQAAAQAASERLAYLEAIKPHTLWSFLGMGPK